jgi:uncharacterized protein
MCIRYVLVAAVAAAGIAAPAAAQSFDCAKAQTRIERMVCADRAIADLDEYLGRYYSAARAAVPAAESCLRDDQQQWLKTKREACQDATCLRTAYLERLAELDPLQPGVTALKNVSLPAVPALVWIVPPAADTVAAPPNAKATPFEAVGTLVDDIASNPKSDGITLLTNDSGRIPVQLTMFLDGATQDAVASLVKQGPALYRARGYALPNGRGGTFFEPSRCVFLHRMPAAEAKSAITAPAKEPDTEQDLDTVRARVVTQGKVCGDPDRPCDAFKSNELSFAIARPFSFDRGRDKSQPFFAVILESGPLCGIDDQERVRAQKVFPRNKVFLRRHMCEGFGDKVTYSNVNGKSGFLAVYGGGSESEARPILALAKSSGFPGATIRRMEVIVVYQIE